ncbi:PfkB family carbohydrate kinase [Micromonospora sp. CA-240977]|uniref:PfkB family carbohydrate kinase n=1 Tax=Micromonospora sp. CA-240977 TaxID=3239957 RepID=UPI003D92F3A3
MKAVVAGDVLFEVNGHLRATFPSLLTDRLFYGDVAAVVGGSAANFALAATALFDEVVAVAAVGGDAVGEVIRAQLEHRGVRARLAVKPDLPSAVAIYVRDEAEHRAKGARLLLVGEPAALGQWDTGDAETLRSELVDADVLVVDGYALRAEPRRAATLTLMAQARASGAEVVYDIVPHDVFRSTGIAEVRRYGRSATIIVAEARTLNALAGEDWTDADTGEQAAHRAATFGARTFPGRRLHVRFGLGNADRTLTLSPDGDVEIMATGYAESDEPRGFGDRLLASELATLLRGRRT